MTSHRAEGLGELFGMDACMKIKNAEGDMNGIWREKERIAVT